MGETIKFELKLYYLSYTRYIENVNKLTIFCSTLQWYSGSVLDGSLIRLKVNDELINYNDKYEYKFDEKLQLIGNIKSCGF